MNNNKQEFQKKGGREKIPHKCNTQESDIKKGLYRLFRTCKKNLNVHLLLGQSNLVGSSRLLQGGGVHLFSQQTL